MSVSDWSTTASDNTTIDGISIAENCSPANVNNAIRSVMAAVAALGFTSFIQTLLDDADANAARTTLGAATLENVTASNPGTFTIRVGTTQIIVKWGAGSHSDNTGAKAITFGTPFPNGCVFSMASNAAGAPPSAFHGSGGESASGFTVYSASAAGVAAPAGVAFWWLAIGY